jgi:signal transduction histidine kinase
VTGTDFEISFAGGQTFVDGGNNEKVSILLVDDQPARLLSYESILSELNQNLVSVRSGVEALERLMKEDFAVVLLDVSMPGMDGFETAAMIHDHPRFERTPIIFVTGVHDTEFDRLKGYKVGAVDYVSIPIVPEILRGKVSVLVELYCQRRELRKLNRSLAEANTTLQAEKARELEIVNRNLQQANKALQEADRHKDEFIAILAHELRNPLAPIRSAVEIMTHIPLADERLVTSRDIVGRQVTHLSRLVDDLLDVSRITRGTIKLNKERLDLGTLLQRAIESVQPFITECRHELSVQCSDETAGLDGDLTRLVQALSNILNNAAKYMPSGGRIELVAGVADSIVQIRVKDEGIGIAPESLPKLFSLFSRLKSDTDQAHSGLGIGLALARQLVELHGGTVSVASEGLNCGSEFTIRLPLAWRAPAVSPTEAQSAQMDHQRTSRRVLVADDNLDALNSLAMLIELAGHEVRKAADGREALDVAAEWRPDLVLLDIGMPVLDGYEVVRRIRAESWGTDMQLVAVSGWGQTEDRKRAIEAGFDMHFVKPIGSDSLTELLTNTPAQKRRLSVIGSRANTYSIDRG